MGPTWVLSAPDGPHVGPMDLAIREAAFIITTMGISIPLWYILWHLGIFIGEASSSQSWISCHFRYYSRKHTIFTLRINYSNGFQLPTMQYSIVTLTHQSTNKCDIHYMEHYGSIWIKTKKNIMLSLLLWEINGTWQRKAHERWQP